MASIRTGCGRWDRRRRGAAVGVGALAVAFMWWARLHLGRLWSGGIVTKENHRIVDTGPYGLVRHPIYTGLFVLALATAALKGDAASAGGRRHPDRGLHAEGPAGGALSRAELGQEAYAAYRKRVPMLVPFL